MAKYNDTAQSSSFLGHIVLRRKTTTQKIEEFYTKSRELYKNDPKYFDRFIQAYNIKWTSEKNKKNFDEIIIKKDIEYQYNQCKYISFNRKITETFYFHLLQYKFTQEARARKIKLQECFYKLLSGKTNSLSDLLKIYEETNLETAKWGIECSGDLKFIYKLFQQTIVSLVDKYKQHRNLTNNFDIPDVINTFLQNVEVVYNEKGLEYQGKPFAGDQVPTLKCDITEENISILRNISIPLGDDTSMKWNPKNVDNLDINKHLETLAKFQKASKWEFVKIDTPNDAFLINNVIREKEVKELTFSVKDKIFIKSILDTLESTRIDSLKHLTIRNSEIKIPLDPIFLDNKIETITLENCKYLMMNTSFDLLQLNPYLKELHMDNCGITALHLLKLVNFTFPSTREEIYDNLLKLNNCTRAIKGMTKIYNPVNISHLPNFDGTLDDQLFWHMIHAIFTEKYKVHSDDIKSVPNIILKEQYKRILPKSSLENLDDREKENLNSFVEFIKKDHEEDEDYEPGLGEYYKALLDVSSKSPIADKYPFLNKLVKQMLDHIYFGVGPVFPSRSKIHTLSLKNNGLDKDSAGAIAIILVSSYKTLTALDLSCNKLKDNIASIVEALKYNEHLTSLNLSNNGITDNGGIMLAELFGWDSHIVNNNTLKNIDISENNIRQEIEQFIKLAGNNNSWSELTL